MSGNSSGAQVRTALPLPPASAAETTGTLPPRWLMRKGNLSLVGTVTSSRALAEGESSDIGDSIIASGPIGPVENFRKGSCPYSVDPHPYSVPSLGEENWRGQKVEGSKGKISSAGVARC